MKINQNFLGGGGCKTKKPSMGGVWIFSGTAHLIKLFSFNKIYFHSIKYIFDKIYFHSIKYILIR